MSSIRRKILLSGVAAMALASRPAFASDTLAADGTADDGGIGEIVVTAPA